MKLLVSMGLKRGGDPAEPLRPSLRVVDWPSRAVVGQLDWDVAPNLCAGPDDSCEFTSAELVDGLLLQPTRSEVLWISPGRLEVVRRLSHPLFYDVHDACALPGGQLAVACTGHESVVVLDAAGALVRHRWLRDGSFAHAYPGVDDFRALPLDRFKPHTHHPNHVFALDGALWVTLFEQREARALDGPGRVALPEGPPHDGRLREGLLWFTTVTGHVVAVDPRTLERRVHLDLNRLSTSRRMLGWCRGVEVVGDRLWVGMTMLRASRHREALRWLVKGERGRKLPTRVLEIDWRAGRIVGELELGNAAGGTIYALNALEA